MAQELGGARLRNIVAREDGDRMSLKLEDHPMSAADAAQGRPTPCPTPPGPRSGRPDLPRS